jgi:hypothetical protein
MPKSYMLQIQLDNYNRENGRRKKWLQVLIEDFISSLENIKRKNQQDLQQLIDLYNEFKHSKSLDNDISTPIVSPSASSAPTFTIKNDNIPGLSGHIFSVRVDAS